MMLKLSTWLVVALAAGALMAGCGSGGSTSSSTSSSTTTSSQTAIPPANAQQAVTSCEQAVRSQHTIPASAKAKLEGTCKKAAGGGQAGLQDVAREVCIQLLDASHVPAGATRDQALAACKTINVK
jgi:hypothetical protein